MKNKTKNKPKLNNKIFEKMNMHTERTELLSTNLLNLGQNRTNPTTTTSIISTEDKDSIYTFSDNCNSDIDESDTFDHERFTNKYGNKLSAGVTDANISPYVTDRNLNNTRNTALKDSIRTYQKKKQPPPPSPASSSSFSPSDYKKPTTTTMTSPDYNTLSCLSLPSPSSIHLSPPSDDSNYQLLKCNGKLTASKCKQKKKTTIL